MAMRHAWIWETEARCRKGPVGEWIGQVVAENPDGIKLVEPSTNSGSGRAPERRSLTVRPLLKLSEAFREQRFTRPRSVQKRLEKLRDAGWVRRRPYATASWSGTPDHCKLPLVGYRLVYGERAPRVGSDTGATWETRAEQRLAVSTTRGA